MDLAKDDFIVGAEVVADEGLILSISELGYGKRTNLTDYRLTNRGVKGVINMKTTRKTGNVVAILSVKEDSDLMIVTRDAATHLGMDITNCTVAVQGFGNVGSVSADLLRGIGYAGIAFVALALTTVILTRRFSVAKS